MCWLKEGVIVGEKLFLSLWKRNLFSLGLISALFFEESSLGLFLWEKRLLGIANSLEDILKDVIVEIAYFAVSNSVDDIVLLDDKSLFLNDLVPDF